MVLVPSYPQPYRLFNPWTGHPLYSGPNGQPGYATAQPQSDSWVQPDGVRVWFYDTSTPDANNRVALGLDVSSPNDPGIGYAGAYAAAVRHGADPQQADLFAAIAMAESSAHWSDHNSNPATGDDSIGLWQINLRAHPQYRATNLYNIDANAQAASEVSGGWTNATPWSTFTSGAYKQFLRGGTAPVGQIIGVPPPPPPGHGPVRQSIDAIISSLPDPSIFGFHPRDLIADALGPLGNAVDDALAFILSGLAQVRDWVAHAADNITAIVTPFIDTVVGFASAVLRAAIAVVDAAWREGVALATGALRDVIHGVEVAARDALDFGIGAVRALIGAVETAAREALDFGIGALRDVIHGVETAARDALDFGIGALRSAIGVVDAAWQAGLRAAETALRDVVGAAEVALRDAIGAVDAGWKAFVHDVFSPLEREARHWFDDVLGPVEPLLHALGQLGDWIVAAARVLVFAPRDLADTVAGIAVDDIISGAQGVAAAWPR